MVPSGAWMATDPLAFKPSHVQPAADVLKNHVYSVGRVPSIQLETPPRDDIGTFRIALDGE